VAKFLHAADLHLDSPLVGLESYGEAPVGQIRQATREALKNLVKLACDEQVDFVLLAGDIYDGDWKDYNTGLFFAAQMAALREHNIKVFLISGNHDAESRISKDLTLPENVFQFSSRKPETKYFETETEGFAIHGQSFPQPEVREDLSQAYPQGERGRFNIGLLHTCATGREGHHPYAPCKVDGLCSKDYKYWALGHVHARECLRDRDPVILFPGNIQGRHVRETGRKGCTLVTVNDGAVVGCEERALDVLRWAIGRVDAAGVRTPRQVFERAGKVVRAEKARSDGLPLALRVEITGACDAHGPLLSDREATLNEIRAVARDQGGEEVWIEQVKILTRPPAGREAALQRNTFLSGLVKAIGEAGPEHEVLNQFRDENALLLDKLPRELKEGAEKIDVSDSGKCRELLEDVRELLVQRLLDAGGRP